MAGGRVLCSGWLKKAPRGIRCGLLVWRKRWFLLRTERTSDDDEGVLEYYKNDASTNLLGSVELSLCEAVDSGVTFHNTRQPDGFVFAIHTHEDTLYLLSTSREDMNRWVQCICQIRGFRQKEEAAASQENESPATSTSRSPPPGLPRASEPQEPPPPGPVFQPHPPLPPLQPASSSGRSEKHPCPQQCSSRVPGSARRSGSEGDQIQEEGCEVRGRVLGLPSPKAPPEEKEAWQSPPGLERGEHEYPSSVALGRKDHQTKESVTWADHVARKIDFLESSTVNSIMRNPRPGQRFLNKHANEARGQSQDSWKLPEPHWLGVGFKEDPGTVSPSPTHPGSSESSPEGTYIDEAHDSKRHRRRRHTTRRLNAQPVWEDDSRTFPLDEIHKAEVTANPRSPDVIPSCPPQKPHREEQPEWDIPRLLCQDKTQARLLESPSITRDQSVSNPVVTRPKVRLHKDQKEPEPVHTLEEPQCITNMKARRLEKMVTQLIPALRNGDPFALPDFLGSYRMFGTTQQVLDLLFTRYDSFCPDSEDDEHIKNILCSILGTWLEKYPEDFCQPTHRVELHQLMAYVLRHLPCSHLAEHIALLLTHLEDSEPKEAEPKAKLLLQNPDKDKVDLEQPRGGSPRTTSSLDLGLSPAHGPPSMDQGDGQTPHTFLSSPASLDEMAFSPTDAEPIPMDPLQTSLERDGGAGGKADVPA